MSDVEQPAGEHQAGNALPRRHVSTAYVAILAVGLVVGAGIYKSPAFIAANTASGEWMLLAWLAGGACTLAGALCYAELATTFPSAGGDYHFLKLSYGRGVAFLFAWGRLAVINTGAMALLAYAVGDYAQTLLPLGAQGAALYALGVIGLLTLYNLGGTATLSASDLAVTVLEVSGVLAMGAAGVWIVAQGLPPLSTDPAGTQAIGGFGQAMVFVLLAFGGWNDISTLSAEIRDDRRGMARALVAAVLAITLLFVFANWALWRGLGLGQLSHSDAPAIALARRAFGEGGVAFTMLAVSIAALTSLNAIMIVGARTTYAIARDWPLLALLARWDERRGAPINAMIAQSLVAAVLVIFGAVGRGGFSSLVDYTAPVYWFFLLLAGGALFVLRRRFADVPRPFAVPLYPLTPLVLCAFSALVLWSSLAYVKTGAFVGLGVLAAGLVVRAVFAGGR